MKETPDNQDDPFYDGLRRIRKKMTAAGKHRRKKNRLAVTIATISGMIVFVLFLTQGSEERSTLKFEDATLEYIVDKLERSYKLTIAVPDERLLKRRFTGIFYQSTGDDVLRSVAETLDIQYEITGQDQFRITEKGRIP